LVVSAPLLFNGCDLLEEDDRDSPRIGTVSAPPGFIVPSFLFEASDFPFHELADPEVAGDPACTEPIWSTVNAGVLKNNFPNGDSTPVCDAANVVRDTDDVASSMGVHVSRFADWRLRARACSCAGTRLPRSGIRRAIHEEGESK